MSGRFTRARNAIAANFVENDQTTLPTRAEFEALDTGYTTMQVRRIFASFSRGMKTALKYAIHPTNVAPVYVGGLAAQTVEEGAVLSYQFANNLFTDADNAFTYTATLEDNSALPTWLTFTAATRTFGVTAPEVEAETVFTVKVTATDIYGKTASGTFTITITVAA
jgi:hypothetical protein